MVGERRRKRKKRAFSGESHAGGKVCDVLMRMIIVVGTEDTDREMSRNGTHILAAPMFLQKMMRI